MNLSPLSSAGATRSGSASTAATSTAGPEDPVSVLCALFPTAGLTSRERAWLTRGCLERFLAACNQDAGRALSRLLAALHWRSLNSVWNILRDGTKRRSPIRAEAFSGKLYVLPQPDHRGRAVVVCRPAAGQAGDDSSVLELIMYSAERACRVAGEEQIVLVVDCTGLTRDNAPSCTWVNKVARTLADMYPERLGLVLVFNAHATLRVSIAATFRLAPYLTRKKLHFSSEVKMGEEVRSDPVDWKSVPLPYRGETLYDFDAKKYFATPIPPESNMSYFPMAGMPGKEKDGKTEVEKEEAEKAGSSVLEHIKVRFAKTTNKVTSEDANM